ncbi:hypothetical protein ACS0TY_032008 [Phlomoides rotata]
MYSRLSEVERVRDVFIPKRVNREGKRFGFVRFGSNIDKCRVEQELNDIWFGSYKLRANLSKFDKKSGTNKADSNTKMTSIGPSNSVQGNAWRKSDISYAEAVKGSLRQPNENRNNQTQDDRSYAGLRYVSTVEDRERLKGCFIGILKEKFLWIKEACEGRLSVNYLGGHLVLVQPSSELDIQDQDLERIAYWFESIRPWCESDVDNKRVIWTQWFWVPMHAWNSKFFKLVSTKFGHLIRLDEDTFARRKLQMARVLIRTSRPEIPREPFAVLIDERVFHIRIREEVEDLEDDYEEWSSDEVCVEDGDDSSWSKESDSKDTSDFRSVCVDGEKEAETFHRREEQLDDRDIINTVLHESRVGINETRIGTLETPCSNKSEAAAVITRNGETLPDTSHDKREVGHNVGTEIPDAETNSAQICAPTLGHTQHSAQSVEKILIDLNGPSFEDGPIHSLPVVSFNNPDEDWMETSSESQSAQNSQMSDEHDTCSGEEINSGLTATKWTPSKAWDVGKKLGLIGKVTDEAIIKHNEDLERKKRRKAGKEAKLETMEDGICKAVWGRQNFDWAYKEAEGRSGGILSIWNDDIFCKSSSWHIKVWRMEERVGRRSGGETRDIDLFNEFIIQSNLVDMHLTERSFMWYRPDGSCKSRIDRIMVNKEWLGKWPNQALKGMGRSISDHIPIYLDTTQRDWGPRPFRFFNTWMTHSNFKEFFKAKWTSYQVSGWTGFRLKEKLKFFRNDLKIWNREVFGHLDANIEARKEELESMDIIDDTFGLEEPDIIRRKVCTAELLRNLHWKEAVLFQKSKAN